MGRPALLPDDRHRGWILVPLALPFLLFSWMTPFLGSLTISHDYVVYSIGQQLELQLALELGELPIFVPGFAAGAPAPALMLGQLYHPISHLAAALPGYWDGLALEWNTFLRLLSLGVTQLILLIFLRRLGLATGISFCVSFVTVYNLRMLDLFRYGASLEGYTATLLLCTSLAWHSFEPTRRIGPCAIALTSYLLLVSGHPQISYYGMLAAGFVWLFAPWLIAAVAPGSAPAGPRVRFEALIAVGLGSALAAIFLLPLWTEFIRMNEGRVGQTYLWSTNLQDGWLGALRNFFQPLSSNVHGAFGGSALALAAVLAPFFGGRRTPAVLWLMVATVGGVVLYSLGDATPIHRFVWSLLPGQQSIRVPGRATLLLPVLFFWLLAWLFRSGQRPLRFIRREIHPSVPPLLAAAVLTIAFALSFWSQRPSPFSPIRIREVPDWVPVFLLASGLVSLLALAGAVARRRFAPALIPVALAALVAQASMALAHGTWVDLKTPTPTLNELLEWKARSLDYPGAYGHGMYSRATLDQLERTFIQPEPVRLFARAETVPSRDEAHQRMRAGRSPDTALIEVAMPALAADHPKSFSARASFRHAGFNRWSFDVWSNQPTVMVVPFAHTQRWRATLDDEPARVHRANGYETAIQVPAGLHTVVLRYTSSATQIGGAVSAFSAAAILLWCVFPIRRPVLRIFLAATILIAVSALAVLTVRAIEGGRGFGTRYEWRAPPANESENVAYGRPARSSDVVTPENLHQVHASRAVDGDRATAFVSRQQGESWWEVDLELATPLSNLRLVRPDGLAAMAESVELSLIASDGTLQTVDLEWNGPRIDVPVPTSMPIQTIRLRARPGKTLALAEVAAIPRNPASPAR